jgi:hypothetical protein
VFNFTRENKAKTTCKRVHPQLWNLQHKMISVKVSVVDPDPDSMTLWIRIQIGNPDPGSRDKKMKGIKYFFS